MENDQSTPDESPAVTPPSEAGEVVGNPPSWPGVLGTISIVFGASGLVCYGCLSLQIIATPFMVGMVSEDQRPPTAQGIQLFVQIFQMCAAAGLSVWLLIAGIGLARRRPWGRTHTIAWAAAKIIMAFIGMMAGITFAAATVDQINSQLSQNGPAPFTVSVIWMYLFIAIAVVWALLWPVFLLIWFNRRAVKDEVAAWAAESRAMI